MTTPPITPFWFKQRQCKMEPVGTEQILKVSGPNLNEAYIYVKQQDGGWLAGVRKSSDGPDLATSTTDRPSVQAAWDVAFELYRTHYIV